MCCSTTASSEFGNGESSYSSISSDGRYVAFSSNSTNLVSGDTNAVPDIFRKDLMTGEVACCSITASSVWGNRESSYQTSIDATGNLVFFQSYATNFIPDDNTSSYDIFRKNLTTGELICCSRNTNGTKISGSSEKPVASPDGRYVVFLTSGGWNDVYRKDLVTDQLAECSYDEGGKYSYAFTYFEKYSISSDGEIRCFRRPSRWSQYSDLQARYGYRGCILLLHVGKRC